VLSLAGLLAAVAIAPPAGADHANWGPHWGHGYQPHVGVNDCNYCGMTAYAERVWVTAGFRNGFVVGPGAGVPGDCYFHGGAIEVCMTKVGDPWLYGRSGNTFVHTVNNPMTHMNDVKIYVARSASKLQGVIDHEYGHAIGLGHTADTGCVMHDPFYTQYPCNHDTDMLKNVMYNGHYEG
jgi:hypothetical protein